MKKILIIALCAVVALGAIVYSNYNEIVTLSESADKAMANIQSDLQRRYDLIPNLVNTVKGYAKHEEKVFTEVAGMRAKISGGQISNAPQMESALSRLLAVAEAYPQLKASENFKSLQYDLAGTENRINISRKRYNDSVNEYNAKIKRIPGMWFGFSPKSYYEIQNKAEAQSAPKVQF